MNFRALPPQQSRTLAILLLLVVVALIAASIAVPVLLLHRHYDQAIEQQLDLLARYSRISAATPGLSRQLETLKTKNTRSFFLGSPVPALAASEMQEIVKSIAEKHGGKITSIQIPEHKDDGNFRKVTVNIQMSAKIGATQSIFYALETLRPYLILDNVNIRAINWQAQRTLNALEPEFLVQFEAAGYAVLGSK